MKQIAIIGAGNVGAHVASALLHKNLPIEILLVDRADDFEQGQVLDLKDGLLFYPNEHICGADLGDKKVREADFLIITAGAPQKPGETRLDLVEKNISILKSIKKEIGTLKKEAIVMLIANPVDILTQVASEIFQLPNRQVFGSGTLLDSSRLRWRLAEKFAKKISEINGFVLGEHGDSEFVAWSTVPIASKLTDAEKSKIEKEVSHAAYEIIDRKGSTYFGIGAAGAEIIASILKNSRKIFPLSVPLQGEFGLENVSVGVPAILGKNGIQEIKEDLLNSEEVKKLHHSAEILKKLIPKN